MPSLLEKRRSKFYDRARKVLSDRLDVDGLVARGWIRAEQSPTHALAGRVAATLSHACPPEVLLSKPPRRKLSPATVERRAQALIELEQLWDKPIRSRPDASDAEREADMIESALHRRKLAIEAGLMTARKDVKMWRGFERRLVRLRNKAKVSR